MAVDFGFKFNSISTGLDLVEKIGTGGFGTVYKVIDKLADQVYALKKIDFKDSDSRESVLKEVKTLAKINGDRVDLLVEKAKCFGRKPLDPINVLDYYISYQLFKEVIECVQYLHELNPPIIHRDLKPQNILVTYEPVNGRYLKLCDFGLATFHYMESISHSVGVGTFRYRAPEVSSSRKYDSKADIFSLGVIGEDIFDIDINGSENSLTTNRDIIEKLIGLTKLIISMTEHLIIRRPSTCAEVLAQFKHLSLCSDDLKSFPEYQDLAEKVVLSNVQIFIDYSNRCVIDDSSKQMPDLIDTVTTDSELSSSGIVIEKQMGEWVPSLPAPANTLRPVYAVYHPNNKPEWPKSFNI